MTTETWAAESPINTSETGVYSNLWNKGILVQIQGGVWSMETKLDAQDIGVQKVPSFVTLGKKRLLPVKEKNRFLNFVSRARNVAERLGFPFFITGAYFIPFSNYDQLKGFLEKEEASFYAEVDSFIERYEERRAEFLDNNEEYRDILEQHYPEASFVRSKFSFRAVYFMASLSSSVIGDESGEQLYLEWAVQSINSLREEASTAADAIKKSINDGTLDGRTMRRVQTLIDRLTSMDLSNDPELRQAAFSLAANPTSENADALKSAASAVTLDQVRAVVLD